MNDRQLPAWVGGFVGVAVAVLLTWLLREGMQTFRLGGRMADLGAVTLGSWLLMLVSFVLAYVMWSARLHPLITGIPVAWFLIRFAPTLFGSFITPSWYPEWLGNYIIQDQDSSAYIVTGLLVTATAGAILRYRRSQATTAQTAQTVQTTS